MTRYSVVAPVVVGKVPTRDGLRWVDLPQGAVVPEGMDENWVNCHLAVGMIAPIEEPAAVEPLLPPEPEPAPAPRTRGAVHPKAGGE